MTVIDSLLSEFQAKNKEFLATVARHNKACVEIYARITAMLFSKYPELDAFAVNSWTPVDYSEIKYGGTGPNTSAETEEIVIHEKSLSIEEFLGKEKVNQKLPKEAREEIENIVKEFKNILYETKGEDWQEIYYRNQDGDIETFVGYFSIYD